MGLGSTNEASDMFPERFSFILLFYFYSWMSPQITLEIKKKKI